MVEHTVTSPPGLPERKPPSRRRVLGGALAAPFLAGATPGAAHVVVIGGGFGGAVAARVLAQIDPMIEVALLEPNPVYTACPFSNAVIAGLRPMEAQRFRYRRLVADGVRVLYTHATAVDNYRRQVRLADGGGVYYDRLILAPGIDIAWGALPGYTETAATRMPHAWKAGDQTKLLCEQLRAMDDGGVVVMSVPPNPYRCPPGPYERASLIAWYLKTHKPRSKLLVLDAKDTFSKQALFRKAWDRHYPGILEWIGPSDGGVVTRVDPVRLAFETDFAVHKAAVANVIPPQRAGMIARAAGVADRSGWCPIDPVTFESRLVPGLHVIGDAAIAGAMPKSAFAANAQGKACAWAVARLLLGKPPQEPRLINTCYSQITPDQAISIAGVYRPAKGVLADIAGAGGASPLDASDEQRARESAYASAWFSAITAETFG
ncbi:MAG: FCSD flavin-binding domain-containing protein [Acetobacteraceae bacterium]